MSTKPAIFVLVLILAVLLVPGVRTDAVSAAEILPRQSIELTSVNLQDPPPGLSIGHVVQHYRHELLSAAFLLGFILLTCLHLQRGKRRLQEQHRQLSLQTRCLHLSEQRLHQVVEGIRAGTWEWNFRTGEMLCNESWAEMAGYRLNELSPVDCAAWEQLVHPEDLEKCREQLARHFSGELDHYRCELRIRHKQGGWKWVVDLGRVFARTEDGKPLLMAGARMDISFRKDAEQALYESEQRLDQLARQNRSVVWEVDADGRYTYISSVAEEVFGYRPEEVINQMHFYELFPEQRREEFKTEIFASFKRKESFKDYENPILTKQGRIIWVSTNCLPLLNEDGTLRGYRGSDLDITRRKEAQAALQRKNAEVERFVYAVSHDLKGPLVTIKSFLGLLRQDVAAGNARQVDADIDYINGAAAKMEQLLEALLQLSRAGRMDNPPEKIAVRDLVEECLNILAGSIQQKRISIVLADVSLTLYGDRLKMGQVWQNLIENAIKYMGAQQRPRIEIGMQQQAETPVFYVLDNGMGVEPDQAERIFDLYTKLDSRSDGAGLGLSLVKKIVEANGGRIWVESAGRGQGCCFRFTLPQAFAQEGKADQGGSAQRMTASPRGRSSVANQVEAGG